MFVPAIKRPRDSKVVPLSISYFTHRKGDRLGFLLALACLLPILFTAAQTALVLILHSTGQKLAALFLIGQLLNEMLNLVLKNVLKGERPGTAIRVDWGMPSSHTQFMAFLAQCISCIILKANHSNSSNSKGIGYTDMIGIYVHYAWCLVALFWGATGVVSFARIYDGSHYTRQVAVGLCIGALAGTLWGRLICKMVNI
jgi:dolichyldiphosphatase